MFLTSANQTFSLSFKKFKSDYLAATLIGLFFFMLFGIISSLFSSSNFTAQLAFAILFQGSFPVIFYCVYGINEPYEAYSTQLKRVYLKNFLTSKHHQKRLAQLFLLHACFYFLLTFLTYAVGYYVGPQAGLIFHVMSSFLFMTTTWRLPAILYTSFDDGFFTCLKLSVVIFKRNLVSTLYFIFLVHTPLLLIFSGFILGAKAVNSASGVTSSNLFTFLLSQAPYAIHLTFAGMMLQLLFWLIFAIQNYSLSFFITLDSKS
jgi:hypothetical protein